MGRHQPLLIAPSDEHDFAAMAEAIICDHAILVSACRRGERVTPARIGARDCKCSDRFFAISAPQFHCSGDERRPVSESHLTDNGIATVDQRQIQSVRMSLLRQRQCQDDQKSKHV